MKTTTLIIIVAAFIIGGFAGSTYAGYGGKGKAQNYRGGQETTRMNSNYDMPGAIDFVSVRPGVSELPSEDLTKEEIDGLLFMREEEKLARDVYTTLHEKWSLPIFSNIAQSEQTHTEAVRDVLEKYEIADPVVDDSVGIFANEVLQDLYNDLSAQGIRSIEEALTVGAIIEDLDISDLKVQVEKTNNQDITLVYENLLRGSQNHLRAFISQLEGRGGTYEPKYISQEFFDEIVSSNRETGVTGSGGMGGRGWGNRK